LFPNFSCRDLRCDGWAIFLTEEKEVTYSEDLKTRFPRGA
jgi:hypothetical protein